MRIELFFAPQLKIAIVNGKKIRISVSSCAAHALLGCPVL